MYVCVLYIHFASFIIIFHGVCLLIEAYVHALYIQQATSGQIASGRMPLIVFVL